MQFETRRKLAHIFFGVALMIVVWVIPEYQLRPALAILLFAGLVLSFLERKMRLPLLSHLLDVFERPKERAVFPGQAIIMLLAGVLLTELFFDKLLIVSGLIVVTFGDAVAHLVGKRFGRWTIPWDSSKHIEGRVAAILLTWGLLIILWQSTILGASYLPLFLAAAVGMLTETIPFRRIGLDDNLIIPFVVAAVIYLQF